MFLRQLDLTTALRPSLSPEEILLFVQDAVGLYKDKYKLESYQNGHAYLTSHRICYVDNQEPRKYSIAIDLKDVDHQELYAGFIKSSPKITLFAKAPKAATLALRSPLPSYAGSEAQSVASSPTRYGTPPRIPPSPASPAPPRDINATWVCPICSFSNPVPSNFDPSIANASTPLPPCLACGIKPPLVHVVKAAISAMSDRPPASSNESFSRHSGVSSQPSALNTSPAQPTPRKPDSSFVECPRCTFRNHPSLHTCEICGASLPTQRTLSAVPPLDTLSARTASPGPALPSPVQDSHIEVLKLSFRAGGVQIFSDRLRDALIQRKWLLQSAVAVPRPNQSDIYTPSSTTSSNGQSASHPKRKNVGIAGLERRDQELRKNNELVIGSAFEDLEALMTSAKEVIAMAERFASTNRHPSSSGNPDEASALLSASASALGLTATKDMLSASSSSANDSLYLSQLSRDLAEFLTDDAHGILRREGGIMSLVDLWAVFNRRRNGIELVSPADFEKAAELWEKLGLPVRLRRFRSGVRVVQGRERTDEKTCRALVEWVRAPYDTAHGESDAMLMMFGRGVTAQETAEHFGWSVGVAIEELEMAEEKEVLVRDVQSQGTMFWDNYFAKIDVEIPAEMERQRQNEKAIEDKRREDRDFRIRMQDSGLM